MKPIFSSIRWQVQLWYGTFLLLALAAFCLTAFKLVWDQQLRQIDAGLQQSDRLLFRAIFRALQEREPQGSPAAPPHELIQRLQPGTLAPPPEVALHFPRDGSRFFVIQNREGTPLLASAPPRDDLHPLPAPEGKPVERFIQSGDERLYYRSHPHGTRAIIGRDITPELQAMRRFGWTLGAAGLGVWCLGLLGGWWLAGKAIRPIESISETASRIAAGNLRERIRLHDAGNELDQLGHLLNQTFDRLHDALERQRQFTADASHELRTPLSILLSETQRTLKRDRSPEEYREALETCRTSAQRMARLVEMLLLFARQEQTPLLASERQPCDLAALLHETVAALHPLATQRGITLHTDAVRPVTYPGNPHALQVVMSNLLHNALRHAGHGVQITLATFNDDTTCGFSVSDNGEGIAECDLPYLFDRFYRVDKARAGSGDHSGLGLAIAKVIVENHGGNLTVQSRLGEGATFEVRFQSTPANANNARRSE